MELLRIRYFLTCLVSILAMASLQGQLKFEKEYRLHTDEVPPRAMAFVDSLELAAKVRWYREEGLESQTLEAKFKHMDRMHSVEFDTLGRLEDVEIEIEWKDILPSLQDSICELLGQYADKFKIQKIQIQYTGSNAALASKINRPQRSDSLQTKYELIVISKLGNKTERYEYLFDSNGQRESRRLIVSQNASHLEY